MGVKRQIRKQIERGKRLFRRSSQVVKDTEEGEMSEESYSEVSHASDSEYEDAAEEAAEESDSVGSEEEQSHKRTKTNAKKRKQDPFKIPPNKVTEDVFMVTNPFLVEKEWMPEHCRFGEEPNLDPEVLGIIMDVALDNYTRADRNFNSTAKGELANRIKHAALLSDIKDFTKPSEPEGRATKRRKVSECEDCYIATSSDDSSSYEFLPSSNESQRNEHDTKGKASESRGRPDFWVFVKDLRPRQLRKRKMAHLLDPWRLVVVVEAKKEKKKAAIFQAIANATAEIRRNFEKGHVDPVYVLVVTEDHWTYAMVDVAGVVTVINKAVTSASYKEYKATAKLHFSRILQSKISDKSNLLEPRKDLEDQLAEVMELYKRQYGGNPEGAYDGQHLVGTLHIAENWYPLPSAKLIGGLVHQGSKMFYEGLSRCVVGERVKKWQARDAFKACQRCGRINADMKRFAGLRVHPKLAPAYQLLDHMKEEEKVIFLNQMKRIGIEWEV